MRGHPYAKIPWPHRILNDAASRIEELEAERDALREAVETAIPAIEDVLFAAYHRCYPDCCGRPGEECCGNPVQSWSDNDNHTMDALSPARKGLIEALTNGGGDE